MRWLAVLTLAAWVWVPQAAQAAPTDLVRQMVHLLDYIGRDYGAAVSGGTVVSPQEYEEQLEFASTVSDTATKLESLASDEDLREGLARLRARIEAKAPADEIFALTLRLKNRVVERTHLPMAPPTWPDLVRGRNLYAAQCAGCHGSAGGGDGPAAKGLLPPPTNFQDRVRMQAISPFQAFNTIRNGVPETAMRPYTAFTDAEAWDLAFFVKSLAYLPIPTESNAGGPPVSLADLAVLDDLALANRVGQARLSLLRAHPLAAKPKVEGLERARQLLAQAQAAFARGDLGEAQALALAAYLDGVEPLEARLRARDARVVPELEARLAAVRAALREGVSRYEVEQAVHEAQIAIDRAADLLREREMGYTVAAVTAALIMLREGFEAVLVVIALLAVLRRLGADHARRWTHAGWVSALVVGFATWLVSERLVTIGGAERELIEGIVALVAVGVLVYMGLWLHSQSEIRRWTEFVDQKARAALHAERVATFFGLAFLAVYREVFETILFYRALALEIAPSAQSALLVGFLVGVGAIAAMAWAMLKLGARLPLKQFFRLSAFLILLLAVVLVGKGLHALQEMGWLGVTSFPLNVRQDVLGIFPTYETLLGQAALAVIILVGGYLIRRRQTLAPILRA